MAFRISCNSFSTITKLIDPDSSCCLYFFIMCLALKLSNHPIENFGISYSAYCGNFFYNITAIYLKISPIIMVFFFLSFTTIEIKHFPNLSIVHDVVSSN